VAALASVASGAKPIPLGTVADALVSYDPANLDHLVVQGLRVPRTLVGVLVGAALGLTEELVHEVFGLRSRVILDEVAGTPHVLPIGRHHAPSEVTSQVTHA